MKDQKKQFVFVFVIIIIAIFFSLGKISYALNPLVRYIRLQQYISEVRHDNTIDPEQFWEFRDFYTSSTSNFNPDNLAVGKPFLSFQTSRVTSYDYLLKDIPKLAYPKDSKLVDNILTSNDELVYIQDNILHIRFIKSQSEMQKANGYFAYFGTDLKPYIDYYWYNDTTIRL